MFKITWIARGRRVWVLKLEGELRGPWVEVLREAFRQRHQPSRPVRLDLSSVTYVDTAGVLLLRDLIHEGIEVASCSRFIAELLRLEDWE